MSLQALEATHAFSLHTENLQASLAVLKEIGKSADLDLIIQAENSLILNEQNLYAPKDPSVLSSLNAAVTDFTDSKNALEVVKTPEAYQATAATYRAKKKLQGVVVDGAHEALNGHITRLPM